ncbi:MAG: hypothetical protein HY928_06660 [Elusimicrobia bacterium]|nr:hypothetical protein [Elusimicrobiota bacterium]
MSNVMQSVVSESSLEAAGGAGAEQAVIAGVAVTIKERVQGASDMATCGQGCKCCGASGVRTGKAGLLRKALRRRAR